MHPRPLRPKWRFLPPPPPTPTTNPTTSTLPLSGVPELALANESKRIATTIANSVDARRRRDDVYWAGVVEADEAELAELRAKAEETPGERAYRRLAKATLLGLGWAASILAGLSWVRWIVLNTNDPLLASLLAAMVPVTATGLHYAVWRTRDRTRSRLVVGAIVGLALSGIGLLAAVAARFGVDAPITNDLTALLAGDDNRWVMIPADLIGVFGGVLLMAWADDVGRTRSHRIRDLIVGIARNKARIETYRHRQRRKVDRATRRAMRLILKAYHRIP